jgi:hypothetical protein
MESQDLEADQAAVGWFSSTRRDKEPRRAAPVRFPLRVTLAQPRGEGQHSQLLARHLAEILQRVERRPTLDQLMQLADRLVRREVGAARGVGIVSEGEYNPLLG